MVVSDIKKSIDLMDEFVDGDYEFMELKIGHEKEVAEARQMYSEIQILEEQIAHLSRVIDDDDFGAVYDLVWKYRESRIQT